MLDYYQLTPRLQADLVWGRAGVIGAGAMGAGGGTCVGKDGCIGVVIRYAPRNGAIEFGNRAGLDC